MDCKPKASLSYMVSSRVAPGNLPRLYLIIIIINNIIIAIIIIIILIINYG